MLLSRMDWAMLPMTIRRAAWKRVHRAWVDEVYRRVISEIDRDAIRALATRFPAPAGDIGPNKYLDLNIWLRDSVIRALRLGLDEAPPLRILDMGSGTGYFLLVARALGHDVRGIDLGDVPVFNEMIRLFGLARQTHRVTSEAPLPHGDERFDLITAFMVTFNGVEFDWEWGAEEWAVFLRNCLPRLAARGRLFLTFNYCVRQGRFYDRSTAALFDSQPGYRVWRSSGELLIRHSG